MFITLFFALDRIIALSKEMKEIIVEKSILYYYEYETIDKLLLIFTGANFPVSNFPYLVEQFCYTLPLTRSILLAQKLIGGESIISNIYLIRGELMLAFVFLILGIVLLKNMEKAAIKGSKLDLL